MDGTPALNVPPRPSTPPKKKGNGLAITALVFSAIFFLPIIPTIGLVLGIIALVTGRSKAISIVAICLGAFFSLLIGLQMAIAVPAFMKYVRRSKTLDATAGVSKIGRAVNALTAQQFSALAESDWTPPGKACGQPGDKFAPDAAAWQAEPWKTLGFAINWPTHYQFRVVRNAQGFLVEARGDLDCDGKLAHFQRQVTSSGLEPLETTDEIE